MIPRLLVLLMGLLVLAAVLPIPGMGTDPPRATHHAPRTTFCVFWCSRPQDLKHATHVTPQVWVEGDALNRKKYPDFSQDSWLKRNVLPLRWRGGLCHRDKTEGELADEWASAWKMGYKGIAIDEFGFDHGGEIDRKMAGALRKAKKQAPDLFIAVWQTRKTSDVLWQAFAESADLVMLECYVGGDGFPKKFEPLVAQARQAGVLSKTVLALGINDQLPEKDQKTHGRWANSKAELEAQVRWLRENAPEMPGVVFFAPAAGEELVRFADELCGKHFQR